MWRGSGNERRWLTDARGLGWRRSAQAQDPGQEAITVGVFLDDHVRGLAGAVAGAGLDTDEHGHGARLAGLQLGRVLEAVARHHAVVAIGRGHQYGRVLDPGAQVVVGAVGLQVRETSRGRRCCRSRWSRPSRW